MRRYASSTDVARLAGVSQSAVSRTYRPGSSVSPETRQKVLAAAETLGYRPSMIPQIMLGHRSRLVAIVIGGMYNPFYAGVLEEFTVKLQAIGHQVLLVHVDSGHTLDAVIPRLASYRVDAIVSALAILSPRAADELARFKIPVITFNTPVKNEWVSSVSCDNEAAAVTLADLLVQRGAKSFGYITGPSGSPAHEERLAGFRKGLAGQGVSDLTIATGDFRYEGGFRAAQELASDRHSIPDAIFCANDLMAMGAIDAIRTKLGMRVPEDVMVAGFDNIPEASWAAYDLTTFAQNAPLMVDKALEIVKSTTEKHASAGEIRIVIEATLVERGSTRAV